MALHSPTTDRFRDRRPIPKPRRIHVFVDRRNGVVRCRCSDLVAFAKEERIGPDDEDAGWPGAQGRAISSPVPLHPNPAAVSLAPMTKNPIHAWVRA